MLSFIARICGSSLASSIVSTNFDKVYHLLTAHPTRPRKTPPPTRQSYDTVCLFLDISGFTALSEKCQLSGAGPEVLAQHLNSYFSVMCRIIASEGGDVFKFAGDACIVIWPPSDEGMETKVIRAVQCAYAIQDELHEAELDRGNGVSLSVKCGLGIGGVTVLHIGGVLGRMEVSEVKEAGENNSLHFYFTLCFALTSSSLTKWPLKNTVPGSWRASPPSLSV